MPEVLVKNRVTLFQLFEKKSVTFSLKIEELGDKVFKNSVRHFGALHDLKLYQTCRTGHTPN